MKSAVDHGKIKFLLYFFLLCRYDFVYLVTSILIFGLPELSSYYRCKGFKKNSYFPTYSMFSCMKYVYNFDNFDNFFVKLKTSVSNQINSSALGQSYMLKLVLVLHIILIFIVFFLQFLFSEKMECKIYFANIRFLNKSLCCLFSFSRFKIV
jgi:hypothetical protein